MDFEEAWSLAHEATEMVRQRRHLLYTFGATKLPYLCLAVTPDDEARVIVHAGTVSAERPKITLPGFGGASPHDFRGFFPDGGDEAPGDDGPNPRQAAFAIHLARRIAMPPAQYINEAEAARRERGPLAEAVERAVRRLDGENDIRTAVLTSDERIWPLSILLYIGAQVARSASANVAEHLEHLS